MKKLRIDIETFSPTDLPTAGVYRYVEDPGFKILMAGWSFDGSPTVCYTNLEQILDGIPGLWDDDVQKVAHNAAFERICFSSQRMMPGRYLDPDPWHDTQALAALKGRPQSLDRLAKALGATPKDSAGKRLINLFSKPNREGKRNLPEDFPEEWMEFIEYCIQDVDTLIEVDELLGGWPSETERQVFLADQRINDYGIAIDLDMARKADRVAAENEVLHKEEIRTLTGIDNPGSIQQVQNWAKSVGLELPNLRAETIDDLLLRPDLDPLHRQVFELRQEIAGTAYKKFKRALESASHGGRVRGGLRYHGAHTGRWSGRGVQVQNLPRAQLVCYLCKEDSSRNSASCATCAATTEAAVLDLTLGNGADAFTLKALVRALFTGPFTVVDYSAIEARVIAWLAGEEWALDAFREGRDIYVETAGRMFNVEGEAALARRSQGKVAVLALGYNGGVRSLRAMGGEGSDAELQHHVNVWRNANRRITQFWWDLGDALEVGDRSVGDGKVYIEKEGNDRIMRLPSGRGIIYHNVKMRLMHTDRGPKRQLTFRDPRWDSPHSTYGGKLSENATQAVARDVLAEAILRLHDHGYNVVGHVHDEIIVEGEHSVDEITRIMVEPPEWSDGLPIGGEGFTSRRYRKG